MNKLLVGLLGFSIVMGIVACRTGQAGDSASSSKAQREAALEAELQKTSNEGERANAEVERLIEEYDKQTRAQQDTAALKELRRRIQERYGAVAQAFTNFIKAHPKHGGGYIAYGDFLLGHHDEEGAQEQLEKGLKLDKTNPTAYNDLANIHGHIGGVKTAFQYYARAIELDPTEPIYFQNFGTTVFLFRKDAREYYGINEQQVFDKALLLYSNAMRLDPTNFALAVDAAESYYGIKPWRFEAALRSWTNTLALAHDEMEREQVYTHFARVKTQAKRYDEARAHLQAVTNEAYAQLKDRMLRNIQEHEAADKTNAPPAAVNR